MLARPYPTLASTADASRTYLFISTRPSAPTTVTVAGDFQTDSTVGCASIWDPSCIASQMTAGSDGVYRYSTLLDSNSYQFKVALNNNWTVNYGLDAADNGGNIPFTVTDNTTPVRFYYDANSHWTTNNLVSAIVVAAGDFQTQLGCSAAWQADCMTTWLEDATGSGTYRFSTSALDAGNYQLKVACDESWTQSYGTASGGNVSFTVPSHQSPITISYVAATHAISVSTSATATATSLAVSPSSVTYGQATTLTATVSTAGATGNVTFSQGNVSLGTATLGSTGVATLSVVLAGGNSQVTATYMAMPLMRQVRAMPPSPSPPRRPRRFCLFRAHRFASATCLPSPRPSPVHR